MYIYNYKMNNKLPLTKATFPFFIKNTFSYYATGYK